MLHAGDYHSALPARCPQLLLYLMRALSGQSSSATAAAHLLTAVVEQNGVLRSVCCFVLFCCVVLCCVVLFCFVVLLCCLCFCVVLCSMLIYMCLFRLGLSDALQAGVRRWRTLSAINCCLYSLLASPHPLPLPLPLRSSQRRAVLCRVLCCSVCRRCVKSTQVCAMLCCLC